MIIDNIDASSKTRNPWRLCSLNQVEEVKLVLRLVPIWFSCIMFTVVQAQLHAYYTIQGSTMIQSMGHSNIRPVSLQAFIGITVLFAVPFYDRIFVPIARKFTGHPSGITVLQRIGVGLFLSILNMVVSALVEAKRVEYNPKAKIPMIVWWLLPQYMIYGFSGAFAIVGLQELFYDQMPEALRSMGAAAYISMVGVGSFMSNAIMSIVHEIRSHGDNWLGNNNLNLAHLDYYSGVLAGLSALNLCVYVCISMRFVFKKVEEAEKTNEEKWVMVSTHNGEF